jgi:hypothetical protein
MSAVWRPDVNPENGVFSEFEVYWEQLFDQVVFESIFQEKSNNSLRYGSFSTDVLMNVLEDFKREVLRKTINQIKKLPESQIVLFRETQELDFKEFYPTERKRILKARFEEKIGEVKEVKDDIDFLFDNSFNAYLNTYEQLRDELRNIFNGLNLSGGFSNPVQTKTTHLTNQSEDCRIDKLLTAKGVENWGLLIQILKDNDPPLLSKDGLWIGKPKNAVCLWFDLIRKGGFAKHPNSYKELADIFNGEFTGLDIESTMFGKGYPRAEKKFKENLELKINQIPSNTR